MSFYKSRNPPAEIARRLRQESGFGCALCGSPFIEYHHIVEWKDEEHFDPEHMVAICPNCHSRFHRMTPQKQYLIKAKPFNLSTTQTDDRIEFRTNLDAMILGGSFFLNCPRIVRYNDTCILGWRVGGGEFLLTLRMSDPFGTPLLTIEDNAVVFRQGNFWDFEFKYNWIKLKSKIGGQFAEIDLRREPITISLVTFLGGKKLEIGKNSIKISEYSQVTQSYFSAIPGYCLNIHQSEFQQSQGLIGGNAWTIPL